MWSFLRGRRNWRSWASLWTAPASGPASGTKPCTKPGAASSTCWSPTWKRWRAVSMSLQRFWMLMRWSSKSGQGFFKLNGILMIPGCALWESNLPGHLPHTKASEHRCPQVSCQPFQLLEYQWWEGKFDINLGQWCPLPSHHQFTMVTLGLG